ncbi:MAG: bacillithiol biosynthesis cysteine-adding enzyme BshC [Ignavibacteria bacterium]|jgi:bacillithiol biosynthesis cysteine-adding enzyme BshC|nr:bacillithiol biosynthesis cysteine-adding enzyme BshC [Ignavibacteria bacterium]MCU7500458.1 bacillithiol biosynthesis cysteine-adding enzyme BshC [Ignavibacteria bacterium]MCU7511867.1 bacillithiol biosynthesis cysteine-adding enzyme BshC [Ignavibacteria bacterium]MCU7519932.1 bacillithiol biosynthesis cysteine-adding enzyme BshC [Ignavibacteria bacterium]MCU7523007.1 bacillithiol biosynthesis cysteine-adding enzyme BshC [Ignavibacteria bacterium]
MFVNFSDLPGQQNLFLDYMYEFESVKDFYHKDFRDTEAFRSHFAEVAGKKRNHRTLLSSILHDQYENLTPSKKTLENIDLLSSDKTLAVVTGQQLGLYGGPLYTFYKIITAIKLCSFLKDKYEAYRFVPVFWLEGDDHDFDEVRSANLIGESNDVVNVVYNDGEPSEVNRGSMGKLTFNSSISQTNEEVNSILRDNDFKPRIMEKLKNYYKEGETFKSSFRKLLFDIFDEYGIIFFDPQDGRIKELLRPVFRQELENFSDHTKELVQISAELEEVYHAQVKVNPINLFYSDEDGRYLIEPADDDFRLKSKRKKILKHTIMEMLDSNPDKFSPNVLLRPICQDYILPTAFYVGGPGEISYFAQVIPLYKFYNVPQPVVYPRSSLTIVEKNIQKTIDKYSLRFNDFFNDKETLFENVIKSISDMEFESEFQACEREIQQSLDKLKGKLLSIDKTLNDAVSKVNERVDQSLKILKDKTNEAQKKKHESTIRQLNKASNVLFPNGNFQERELSFIYFAHKYGLDIIKWMFSELAINRFEHQITEL